MEKQGNRDHEQGKHHSVGKQSTIYNVKRSTDEYESDRAKFQELIQEYG